ncbi:Zn-dependent oxidoreductase, NADPH:quinone reductase [Rhizobium leguminosarum bv. trifolii WSM2012]|nr:Zn-dependent oxidoreductase, NADPH:quinone reductase [Rhizobium leguminosarum bv. trifolii WSM2012]EJC76447.1 Zn-dependent oxidoreductase, NADPH:quinone reductase [Rhizobium leguminosarum bv. trifolii WSM2012]
MTNLMKAVQFHRFGGPDVLQYEDAPKPQITEKDVLVRVHAVGLNPPDWYLREGFKALTPEWRPKVDFPAIAGTDISGVVEAVGDDVSGFSVGDEVYSMVRFPSGLAGGSRGYAEYVAVSPSELAHKPKGIDHVRAAAAPMSLLTAWQFLIDVGHDESNPLQPHRHKPVPLEGKTVLVNGAAGGVGHFALQLAKWRGAHVIAVASGKNEALLRDLGADKFIDYTRQAPEDVVREVDLVVDGVGGPKSGRFLRTLKRSGSLFPIFSLGFEGADEARERGVTVSTTQVRSSGTQLEEIAPLLSDGTIKVVIDGTYLLEQASDAHARAEQGHIQGKIVLTVR